MRPTVSCVCLINVRLAQPLWPNICCRPIDHWLWHSLATLAQMQHSAAHLTRMGKMAKSRSPCSKYLRYNQKPSSAHSSGKFECIILQINIYIHIAKYRACNSCIYVRLTNVNICYIYTAHANQKLFTIFTIR